MTETTSSPLANTAHCRGIANSSPLRKNCTMNGRLSKVPVTMAETNSEARGQAPADDNGFLVNYRRATYDITSFLKHHPGGKVLHNFRNRAVDNALQDNPHSKSAFHLLGECALDESAAENDIEKLVDWNAPMFWQIGDLKDRYWEWVNLPVNRPVRFFKSDFLEFLTLTPWYVIPLVWLPIGFYFIYAGLANLPVNYSGIDILETVISFVAGVLLWTVLEYGLHRKLFHFHPPANSKFLITFHFLLHGNHHKAPFDGLRLVFPPLPAILLAKLLWNIYVLIFPATMVWFISAGTLAGYLCYDLMHYYLHHGAPAADTYLYNLKRSHNNHHFAHHDRGFGISSKLWDGVLGTGVCLKKLTKPIEW